MILHIIQARSTSKRLPNKILQKIGDKTLLEWHLRNTKGILDDTSHVIATPKNDPKIKEIKKIANGYGIKVHSPDCNDNDVLKRFVMVANEYGPEWIVRTTSDCIMSPYVIRRDIKVAVDNDMRLFDTFNEGSCVEVFKYSDLLRSDNELHRYGVQLADDLHREHVTSYFRKGFKKESIDTPEELEAARKRYGHN